MKASLKAKLILLLSVSKVGAWSFSKVPMGCCIPTSCWLVKERLEKKKKNVFSQNLEPLSEAA